ncbi:MAG: T9SS type A sorting domain-containing protein, partial [Bacteroidota bacterium]
NPFDNETTISFDNPTNSTFTLNLMDVTGRMVLQKTNITGNKYIFNREGLNAGYYMIELRGEKLYRGRIIIN